MHWVQGEKPVEYHVVRWDNSAFHNHDKLTKRKMLGGVSFDGGAGGGKSANMKQTGVQMAQPSFSHTADEGAFGSGLAEMGLYGGGKDGLPGDRNGKAEGILRVSGNQAEADSPDVRGSRDTLEIRTVPEAADVKSAPEAIEMKTALETAAAGQAVSVPEEKRRRPALLQSFRKMGKGIQAFLKGMEQKAGQKHHKKAPKKNPEGTRLTKEEFDRIQTDKSYLLDSYNKYGERSTLGR